MARVQAYRLDCARMQAQYAAAVLAVVHREATRTCLETLSALREAGLEPDEGDVISIYLTLVQDVIHRASELVVPREPAIAPTDPDGSPGIRRCHDE